MLTGIIRNLKNAIEYDHGAKTKGRSTVYYLEPVPEFEAEEIKLICNNTGVT